jgi:hypothetical protein
MHRGRAYKEANALGERYPVYYSEDERRIVIRRFRYPDGWSPRFAELRYELPNTYPRDMPTVYVPATLSYESGSPEHLMHYSSPPGDDGDEWSKWCIENHASSWNPEQDSLLKFTQLMYASLSHPNADNPFEVMEP